MAGTLQLTSKQTGIIKCVYFAIYALCVWEISADDRTAIADRRRRNTHILQGDLKSGSHFKNQRTFSNDQSLKYKSVHSYMLALYDMMEATQMYTKQNDISIQSIRSVKATTDNSCTELHFRFHPSFKTKNILAIELVLSTSLYRPPQKHFTIRNTRTEDDYHILYQSTDKQLETPVHRGYRIRAGDDFDVFDVSSLMKENYITKAETRTKRFKLTYNCKEIQHRHSGIEYDVTSTDEDVQPILVFYFGNEEEKDSLFENIDHYFDGNITFPLQKSSNVGVASVAVNVDEKTSTRKPRSLSRNTCKLHSWYLNFDHIADNNWIIAPAGITANFCKGRCPHSFGSHFNVSRHAVLRTLFLRQNKYVQRMVKPPKARCVPTAYRSSPEPMLYYNFNGEIILEYWDNIVATSCGCS